MLDNQELIQIEKKFSLFNLMLAGMLIIYYLIFVWFSHRDIAPNVFVFGACIFVLLIDFMWGKSDYYGSDFLIKIIKFAELLLFSLFSFYGNGFTLNVFFAGIVYLLISLQVLLTYDITETYSKVAAVVFNMLPLIGTMMCELLFHDASNFLFFVNLIFMFAVVICEVNFIEPLSDAFIILYEKINNLNEIAATNREENNSMKTTQQKLVLVNEQLSIQKFELQKANEQIIRNSEETQLLNQVTKNVTSSFDTNKLLLGFIKNVMEYMKYDLCYAAIINKEELTEEEFIHQIGYTEQSKISAENENIISQFGFVQEYLDNAAIIDISDYAYVKLECLKASDIKSALIYPVTLNDNANAIYMLGSTKKKCFDENKTFLNNLFRQVTLAVNNSLLYSKMHTMAVKDALTGIYNRQYFNSMHNEYMKMCVEHDKILTVALFDIDKFKNINDTYGHVFGDEVIRYCGHMALKYSKVKPSFAVRYGGEEFVMVFPDRNVEEVLKICWEMHEEIKNKEFITDGKSVHINISLGIASYPDNCDNIEKLINSADMAMYNSKRNGRGRITIFDKSEKE